MRGNKWPNNSIRLIEASKFSLLSLLFLLQKLQGDSHSHPLSPGAHRRLHRPPQSQVSLVFSRVFILFAQLQTSPCVQFRFSRSVVVSGQLGLFLGGFFSGLCPAAFFWIRLVVAQAGVRLAVYPFVRLLLRHLPTCLAVLFGVRPSGCNSGVRPFGGLQLRQFQVRQSSFFQAPGSFLSGFSLVAISSYSGCGGSQVLCCRLVWSLMWDLDVLGRLMSQLTSLLGVFNAFLIW